jgi:ion channel-forming bestrophin family protein
MMAATVERGSVPYGEESRQFRRTVFTADDWIQHRNSERILSNLYGLFFSGIVRQLQQELWLVCAVSAAIVAINNSGLVEISLPSLPFQLSSPALGLLLVFRTNASYARWTEGRATWARIDANACNIVRMAGTFTDLVDPATTHERRRAIQQLSVATWAFGRSLMNQLLTRAEDEEEYCREMRHVISDERLVERILRAPDRTVACLTEASLALDRLPIDEKRRVEVDKSLVILGDCLSTCEKIYSSPVPLVYTRHTARFLSFWMLLLPAALYEPFIHEDFAGSLLISGFAVVPAVAIVAVFLFGIQELASALEEPFSILPMQSFCDGLKESMQGVLDWCFESADLEMADRELNERGQAKTESKGQVNGEAS